MNPVETIRTDETMSSSEEQTKPVPIPEKASEDKISMKEKSINKPTPFDGDRKKVETFIQECRMYLQINKGIYTTDEDKIIFILSFMNDKEALRWKQTYLRTITNDAGDLVFPTIKTFVDNLGTYFKPANMSQDAIHQLNMLKQGKKNAEEVVTEFRLLCSQAGFSAETTTDHLHLIERLQRVLNTSLIKKIMLLEAPPTTIEGWVEKAIFFDTMYRNTMEILGRKNEEDKTNRNRGGSSRRFNYSSYFDNRNSQNTRDKKDPNAMDIDAMSTDKRDYLMRKGLCFICEKSGHLAAAHKDKNFGNEKKTINEGSSPKKRDIQKLHAYIQGLSKEETAELLLMQTSEKKETKVEEEGESDF
jgi:Ty3 transposon capsid-like protein